MQGDLISRSELLKEFDPKGELLDPIAVRMRIVQAPTAYDVEKVVAGIGRSSSKGYRDIDGDYVPPMIETKDAIEIVHNGGKE